MPDLHEGTCDKCGRPRHPVDYGETTRLELDQLVGEYCVGVMRGYIGWGISFIDWMTVKGWTHLGLFRWKRPYLLK